MKTVIFSGTTEGRRLSEMLTKEGISHHVCVATEYGCDVMKKSPHAIVHIGRMDSDEIRSFLRSNGFGDKDLVVDATHPYATEVSENIRNAVSTLGCGLIRIRRGSEDRAGESQTKSYVNRYCTMEDFSKAIDSSEGNILLTTGSKELAVYSKNVSKNTLERTYVRILPARESLEICEKNGIDNSHVIAMQGPFSREMNAAVMKQYDIRHLLTKDSGPEGGFDDKTAAAMDLGVSVHILLRPDEAKDPDGISINEAFEKIAGYRYKAKRRIVLAGCGMGSRASMTCEVADFIRTADAVFGASSVVDAALSAVFGNTPPLNLKRYDVYLAKDIIPILEGEVNITNAVLLFSGDSGFYSGAKDAYDKLTEWGGEDADIRLLPGISSVSYLASKLGESYDDAVTMSVHGRNSVQNIEKLVNAVIDNAKVFALLSNDEDVRNVADMLREHGVSVKIILGRDMSCTTSDNCEGENIVTLSVNQACEYHKKGKITALFINNNHSKQETKVQY